MLERGGDERDERCCEEHERDRQIQERDEGEDDDRRQRRHRELRQVLAEIHLELLDAFDHRHDHLARARAGDVRGPERDDVVVHGLAQARLHDRGGPMRHGDAPVLEGAAYDDRRRDEGDRYEQVGKRGAGEDAREQPAEQREPGDAGDDLKQPEHHSGGDPPAHAARESEKPTIEIHRR